MFNKTKKLWASAVLLAMNFKSGHFALNSLSPSYTGIQIGADMVRSISLINIDSIDLPPELGTQIESNERKVCGDFLPISFLSFLRFPAVVLSCSTILPNLKSRQTS